MALRVVLVDDDARFRTIAKRTLIADGVEVVAEAENGTEAVSGMQAWQPDVALVDIGLPDIDGFEVARLLQLSVEAPFVVLISTCDAAYGERMAIGRAAGFVAKADLSLAAIMDVIGSGPAAAD